MTIPLLDDNDVRRLLDMATAVDVMRGAFARQAAGTLIAPSRAQLDVEIGKLVFTAGAATDPPGCLGFRVYDLDQLHSPRRHELTAVFDPDGGALKGLVVGPLLGAVRTGAIGGVAIDRLANADGGTLGVIGSGFQARTQLQAAVAVLPFREIAVYSRDEDRRERFAADAAAHTDADIRVCDSVREVVEAADVLICATVSRDALFDPTWLRPGAHVSTIGPKFQSASELDLGVAERADVIVTDSPAQAAAFGDEFILHGSDLLSRMRPLSGIVAEEIPGRQSRSDITLFYSLGLAGTEVLLADRLLDLHRENADG